MSEQLELLRSEPGAPRDPQVCFDDVPGYADAVQALLASASSRDRGRPLPDVVLAHMTIRSKRGWPDVELPWRLFRCPFCGGQHYNDEPCGVRHGDVDGRRLSVRPLTLRQANDVVEAFHRHRKPVTGHRFSLGAFLDGESAVGVASVDAPPELVGATIVGRPVAQLTEQYQVAEVVRLATDGTRNACSFLYGAAARTAAAMGFQRIQTFTTLEEDGASLRGSGWECVGLTKGGKQRGVTEAPKIKWNKRLRPARL